MESFFFYDLETSGLNPREDRVMQFAGLRTDAELKPLGEPVNLLVQMAEDTLPSPRAIMVTKITPQQTRQDGLAEAEFARYLQEEIFTPGTCAVGYNSVRFDDEFMRHLFWRNFYDPYAWQWQDGRSRWDLLDVVRLTRALRPEGINWPVNEQGKATNRLELLTKENGISHEHAHDALSDVYALVAVTRMIREKQPQLYQYLFQMRQKREVQKLVNLEQKRPFVYASGRYSVEHEKTTVAFPIAPGRNGNVLVFDLRYNVDELEPREDGSYFPIVKELSYNKCPAVAPLGVLEQQDGWAKIGLTQEQVEQNLQALLKHPEFAEAQRTRYEQTREWPPAPDPESALYDGFLSDQDRAKCAAVAAVATETTAANRLADLEPEFQDERLSELLLHYKAKNFPTALNETEQQQWEEYRYKRLNRQAPGFLEQLSALQEQADVDEFIVEELMLWYQSLQDVD